MAESAAKALAGSWFGLSAEDTNWLISAFDLTRTSREPLKRAAAQLATSRLREVISAARKGRSDTLWSRMVRPWQDNGVDDDSLIAFVAPAFDSLAAVSAACCSHTSDHLSREVEVQDQIRSERWATARKAVLESTRLNPVNQTILHECLEGRRLAGVNIAKGNQLVIVLSAVYRDPAAHAAPHDFLLDRKTCHLAFGRGAYACSGREIALAVATTILPELIHQNGLSISTIPKKEPVFGGDFGRSSLPSGRSRTIIRQSG